MRKYAKKALTLTLASVMAVNVMGSAMGAVITAGESRTEAADEGGPGSAGGSSTETVQTGQAPSDQPASSAQPETSQPETTRETQSQTQSQTDGTRGPGGTGGPGGGTTGGTQTGSGQIAYQPEDTTVPPGVIRDGITLDKVYGMSGQIQSVSMKLNQVSGAISYGVYVNNGGYLPWRGDGELAGGTEDSTYIEAIQIAVTGEAAKLYNVYYRGVSANMGQHGWACNEELMGTMGRGDHLTNIEVYLVPKENGAPGSYEGRFYSNFSEYLNVSDNGSTCVNPDGTGYNGWVDHDRARYYFVDGHAVTGWQYIDGLKFYFTERGALVMDVDPLIGKQDSYQIRVNKELNCLTVYAKDGDNGYILPVKSMLTSVGDDTPVGTFRTPEKYRWRFMVNGTYTQYATRITAGFLFHSITYETTNENTLITPGYNLLGVTRSLGCVRLNAWNAKWVYDNCKIGTEVVIYNDGTAPGPFFKPYQVWIPADQTYDPTDPKFMGQ